MVSLIFIQKWNSEQRKKKNNMKKINNRNMVFKFLIITHFYLIKFISFN